jgi:ATP-dependent Clp protease ATP-binding subunit ClpC
MELIIAFAVGAAVAFLVLRSRMRTVAPSSAAPASDSLAPSIRLQQLSDPLNAAGEASAHPRDLADNATFREALEIFTSDQMTLNVVTDYATGANWMLATAACAALCTRPDRQYAMTRVLAILPHMRPWWIYWALRYFNTLDERPPVGALVLNCPEWWAEHPVIPSFLAEHFTERAERGDASVFGEGLSRATQLQLTTTENLLRRIDHTAAHGLLDDLTSFRRSALNRDYLQTFGRFVEGDPERRLLVEHDAVKDQLAQGAACILHHPPRSLLVIGEPRSGKTSFLSLLAVRAEAQGWAVFEAGGAHLQAGQEYIGQLEERLRRMTTELAADKRVLWHAPDFLQLAMSGSHKGQSATILDQVLPSIAAGRIVLLSETTPAALTRVLQQRPALRSALELIRLRPLSDDEIGDLSRRFASRLGEFLNIRIEPAVLETSTYVARHYLGTSQAPGPVLDLLKLSAQRAVSHGASAVQREDVLATMAQLTGMPQQVLDDRERVDLASLRGFFTARVIGQDEAVDAVVDRIAMLKAGLTDTGKPVAVFLFAGPTGTGKTELAKALAEFLFGSADRLIRLDMSEFQSFESLRKIIGDPANPDEAQALTHRVRKQPFSVVLLDEFEKAHPSAWDLFLQVFDGGRLTDAMGHTVDFRHCMVILTSNLGSTIKRESGPGFLSEAATLTPEQVKRAINQSFRPEFINRLDRIIVFRPLTRDHMRSIVAKELSLVLERRGLRHREWAVEWEVSALEFLLDKGFSPAMGARPLKRAIDQYLLAPLAATLVEHRFPEGDQFLFVRSDGRALQVEFVDPDVSSTSPDPLEPQTALAPSGLTLARMMLRPTGAPAERIALLAALQTAEAGLTDSRWTSVEAELASGMQHQDFWNRPDRQPILSRFEVMDRVKAAAATARGLATRLERSAGVSGRYSKDIVSRLASQLFVVRHGIEDALTDAPVEVVLAVQPVLDRGSGATASARWCAQLLEMYRKWASRRGMRVSDVAALSQQEPLLVISGLGAARLLESEVGLHVLDYERQGESGRAVARVIVRPTPPVLPEAAGECYALLSSELVKAPVPAAVIRRYFLDSSPVVRDVKRGWRTGRVELVLDGQFDLIGEASGAFESSDAIDNPREQQS